MTDLSVSVWKGQTTGVISRCSIWPSTANSGGAILSAQQGERRLRRRRCQRTCFGHAEQTRTPVHFQITDTTRVSLERWIKAPEMIGCEHLWPSRLQASPHLSTRHYARIMRDWVRSIGLDPSACGTHSMRRTTCPDLQEDRQLARSPTAAWPHEDGQHYALSRR